MLHDNYSINEKGHFTVGGCDTVELAKKYSTPLYVLDENAIRKQCRIYREAAVSCFGKDALPLYASKSVLAMMASFNSSDRR